MSTTDSQTTSPARAHAPSQRRGRKALHAGGSPLSPAPPTESSSNKRSGRYLQLSLEGSVWHFTLFEDGHALRDFTSPSYAGLIYITKLWLEWSSWSTERLLSELDLLLNKLNRS